MSTLTAIHTGQRPRRPSGRIPRPSRPAALSMSQAMIPIDPVTGAFAGDDIRTQTRQCLQNLAAILAEAGSGMDRVVKTNGHAQGYRRFHRHERGLCRSLHRAVPGARLPSRSARCPKDALVEIECVAAL